MLSTAPITRPSLLVRIRDTGDAEAWHQFVELYAPVIHGFYRKRGLQDADAADLTQAVLQTVSMEAVRLEYDPARGSFRSWLFTIAHNTAIDALRKKRLPTVALETDDDEQSPKEAPTQRAPPRVRSSPASRSAVARPRR